MKIIKKLLLAFTSVILLLTGSIFSLSAEDNLIIHLDCFKIETNYDSSEVSVTYGSNEYGYYAIIFDNTTGNEIDKFSLSYPEVEDTSNLRITPRVHRIFTNTKTEGNGISWTTEVTCDVSYSGSFGQIDEPLSSAIYISSPYSGMYHEDDSIGISGEGGFPTWKMYVTSTTSLCMEANSSVGVELMGIGFTMASTNFYRKRCTNSFTITYGY